MFDFTTAYDLLVSGQRCRLFHYAAAHSDPSAQALQAMLLIDHFVDPARGRAILAALSPRPSAPLALFAQGYAGMALGDRRAAPRVASTLAKTQPALANILTLEQLGRGRQFREQAGHAKRLLAQHPAEARGWVYRALLRSLDQKDIDPAPLTQVLAAAPDPSPVSNLLHWRLSTDSIDQKREAIAALARAHPQEAAVQVARAAFSYNIGDLSGCLVALQQAAALQEVDTPTLLRWISLALTEPSMRRDARQHILAAMAVGPKTVRQTGLVASYLLIYFWLMGDYLAAYTTIKENIGYMQVPSSKIDKPAQVYFNYIINLCAFWQINRPLYDGSAESISIIGESHSLSPHNTIFPWAGTQRRGASAFIMGCKMHHLAVKTTTVYQEFLRAHLAAIPPEQPRLFTIGEIDCRPTEGLWTVIAKGRLSSDQVILDTCSGYLDFIKANQSNDLNDRITIQGIPAPGYALDDLKTQVAQAQFLSMIQQVNACLRAGCAQRGWSFLDVYAATVGEAGRSTGQWHLDGYHLKPSFYQQADRWRVRAY